MQRKLRNLIGTFKQKKRDNINHRYYNHPVYDSWLLSNGVQWSRKDYEQFSNDAYIKNVIAHRAMNMIAKSAASVPFVLNVFINREQERVNHHRILQLLEKPNPKESGKEFLKSIYMYRQISGNAYILAVSRNKAPEELYLLRPDRVSVIADKQFMPTAYRYKTDSEFIDYKIDSVSGSSKVLHIKNFHPLDDHYGLSSIEAASYSIDQHNQAVSWNQSLLQNGARPSGAFVVRSKDGNDYLTNEQFSRLKELVRENFVGAKNAGKPLILEGGLDWKEMSFSPKDMDFIESKNSAARDIALAFGVPPQLLGIPGDNTYSNLKEARIAMWEQTVIPLVESTVDSLNTWFHHYFEDNFELSYSLDNITALASRRDKIWERVGKANFLLLNEKREMVGFPPIEDGGKL